MDNQQKDSSPIQTAIQTCTNNIRRHTRATVFEVFVTFLFMTLGMATIINVAQEQGRQSEEAYSTLLQDVRTAQRNFEDAETAQDAAQVAVDSAERSYELVLKNTQMARPEKSDIVTDPTLRIAGDTVSERKRTLNSANLQMNNTRSALNNKQKELKAHFTHPLMTEAELYGIAAGFVILVSVLVGLYRSHVREIAKNEQYQIGLLRVEAATKMLGDHKAFSEAREGLIKGAFDVAPESILFRREPKKVVESPLPGHFATDFATSILNKVVEQIEVVLKPRTQLGPE